MYAFYFAAVLSYLPLYLHNKGLFIFCCSSYMIKEHMNR